MHSWLWTRHSLGTIGLFFFASILYIRGLCPTIYWNDSPEFVTTAYTLGISHPSGSPTYALVTKLATFIPLGSIAFRVNACSALLGAFAIVLLFSLLQMILGKPAGQKQWAAAVSGALFLLVSESFWRFTEVAEVYILQSYLLLLLFFVLLKARAITSSLQTRYYWLFAFLYGLSAGVHATMALFVPALLLFIGLVTPRMFRIKALAFLAFFFLMGFATHLYLPLRSLAEPAFNWGEPQTFQQFLGHILDRKDNQVHTVFFLQKFSYQLFGFARYLENEFTFLGCMLGLIGFVALLLRDKCLWLMLCLAFLGHTLFFVRIWEVAWGFIPAFVIFALWIGYGVYACLALLETLYQRYPIRVPRIATSAFFAGSVVVVLLQSLIQHESVTNQNTNYAAELYGKQLLEQLPPDSLLFCEYSWFPLLYLQQVEHQRPDLTFLLQGEVFAPTYYTLISQQRFPNIRHITSENPTPITTLDYFWLLSRGNALEHPLFWDPGTQVDVRRHMLPQGLLYRFDPYGSVEITPAVLRTHRKLLALSTNRILQGALEDATTSFLVHKLNEIGRDFRKLGFIDEATKTYVAALGLRPTYAITLNNYGALLLDQGDFAKALEQLNLAYEHNPVDPFVNKNLGTVLLRLGDPGQAVSFFEKALAVGARGGNVYTQLGEAYAKTGRLPMALSMLQTALQQFTEQIKLTPRDETVQKSIALLQAWIHELENLSDISHSGQ